LLSIRIVRSGCSAVFEKYSGKTSPWPYSIRVFFLGRRRRDDVASPS